jgi:hypothetical protein
MSNENPNPNPETQELDLDSAKLAVNQLWQVTQTAPQNAQVHVTCARMKDALIAYLDKKG